MKLPALILFILAHILAPGECVSEKTLLWPTTKYYSSGAVLGKLLTAQHKEFTDSHTHSGHDPLEALTFQEYCLLKNIGVRVEVLLDSFKTLLTVSLPTAEATRLVNEVAPEFEKLAKNLKNSIDALREEIEKIWNNYDAGKYTLLLKEPRSFVNKEALASTFEIVQHLYEMVEDTVEKNFDDEERKNACLWTIKRNMVLTAFSSKIMFLKMLYDLGYAKGIQMGFILPGILYLLVFETGMIGKITERVMETESTYFNKFLERYLDATEDLIDKVYFHIRENELPEELNKTTHRELLEMQKDMDKILRPILTLTGARVKNP